MKTKSNPLESRLHNKVACATGATVHPAIDLHQIRTPVIAIPRGSKVSLTVVGRALLAWSYSVVWFVVFCSVPLRAASPQLDLDFHPTLLKRGLVNAMARQPDGKLIVAGSFDIVNGSPRNKVVRINPDGSLDTSFTSTNSYPSYFSGAAIALQADGRILLGDGVGYWGVSRLNPDGSPDASFSFIVPSVAAIDLQSNGLILVGGIIILDGDPPLGRGIARLTSTGSVDPSFQTVLGGTNLNYSYPIAFSISEVTGGKLLVGGTFATVNGTRRIRIARLEADGSLDLSFDASNVISETVNFGFKSFVTCAVEQPDGKILVGGVISVVGQSDFQSLIRLNSDGTFDSSFKLQPVPSAWMQTIALQADGKILIGGNFTGGRTDGTFLPRSAVARLNSDGSLDQDFDLGIARVVPGGVISEPAEVNSLIIQKDGAIYFGGDFAHINGQYFSSIARATNSSQLDTGFACRLSAKSANVSCLSLQPDQKIIIGGGFDSINGSDALGLARLNSNGNVDSSFMVGSGIGSTTFGSPGRLLATALQADLKLVIGGEFNTFNGQRQDAIARLGSNGSLDMTFNAQLGPYAYVHSLLALQDGKIVVGGQIRANDLDPSRVALIWRLNNNGSMDTSFTQYFGPSGTVEAIAQDGAGGLVICGLFEQFGGMARPSVARLNPNGTLDLTFNPNIDPATLVNHTIQTVALQPDGKILCGGWFQQNGDLNNTPGVIRLNANGTVDGTYVPSRSVIGYVHAIAPLSDGRALVAGAFHNPPQYYVNGIALLMPNGSSDPAFSMHLAVDYNIGANVLLAQNTGQFLVGGGFLNIDDQVRTGLARIQLGTGAVGPTLTVRSAGNNLTLLWPDSATGYRVESKLSLSPPSSWSGVAGTLQTNGGFISMVLPTPGVQKFFRLVKP
jgi:uncharacterized delta-60 repeat protein